MNPLTANPSAPDGCGSPPPREGWTRKKFFLLIALALVLHLALIFAFGTKKQPVPRTVTKVPQTQFASRADELLELDNPALFVLPNPRSFSTALWQHLPDVASPTFLHSALPCELPAPQNLGTDFQQFMQTNRFEAFQLSFQPTAMTVGPVAAIEPALPQHSTLEITGGIAQRRLLTSPSLPSLAFPDVLPPSKIQVLVDKSGNVASAILLPPESPLEATGRADKGDTNALILVRDLKFTPAARLAFGEVVFHWHTVPLTDTNTP